MKRNEEIDNIVREYSPRLLGYIRSQVGTPEDAEDILQDVFYQLSRQSNDEYSGIERVSAWLYRVARNSVLNFWRKRREISLSSIYDDFDDEACGEISNTLFNGMPDTPDNIYLRKLVWQELDQALSELPPEQSEIFCLTVFDGLPVKDISANIGIPVATLLSRKHYAVKFLRRRFNELYTAIINRE